MPEFQTLLDGYNRFRETGYQTQRSRWRELAEGQEPPVMIVACCDSRVDPGMIFDIEPGQAFILRNVANIVPPFERGSGLHGVSSAVEYAVRVLKVRHIVVMGHAACGGVAAALNNAAADGLDFVSKWIALLGPARDKVVGENHENMQLALELEAIRSSLANLRTFPWIRECEDAGTLKLHGCHFSIAEGRLRLLDEAEGEFRLV